MVFAMNYFKHQPSEDHTDELAGSCESSLPPSSFDSLRGLINYKNALKSTAHERTFENSYLVGKKLGSGGSCEVFEVRCVSSNNRFACKRVRKHHNLDHYGAKHFRDKALKKETDKIWEEINLLNRFQHPNILKVQEAFNKPTEVILILQLASHGELYHALKKHSRFNMDQAATIIQPLFSALKYLHIHKVMHRDIKLENILLLRDIATEPFTTKDIVLADFGLAKDISSTNSARTLCGSQYYVAPEVITGNGYSCKADCWSLGVVLYMILSDTPPFYDDDRQGKTLYDAILTCDYTTNNKYWRNVTNEAKDLVHKLLTLNVKTRMDSEQSLCHPFFKHAVET